AAGLTTSQLGTGGGAMLAKAPGAITLLDIRAAVEDMEVFALHRAAPNPKCLVGPNITGVLEIVAERAERAVRDVLGDKTLADVASEVLKSEAQRGKRRA